MPIACNRLTSSIQIQPQPNSRSYYPNSSLTIKTMNFGSFNPSVHHTPRRKLYDSYSTIYSPNIDSVNSHCTPPNSPQSIVLTAPNAEKSSVHGSMTKMSLDFIAPGGRSGTVSSETGLSTPHSSARNSPEHDTPTGTQQLQLQLPSIDRLQLLNEDKQAVPNRLTVNDSLPLFIPPSATSAESARKHSRGPLARKQRLYVLATNGSPTPLVQTNRHQTKGQNQREDRHPYDPEEIYAMMYLRDGGDRKWADVLQCFHHLFPIGQPRRFNVPVGTGSSNAVQHQANLPPVYPRRNIQGLQCRWYRVREQYGLSKLREDGSHKDHATRRREEKPILEEMERSGELSEAFLAMVKDVGTSSKRIADAKL